MTKLIEVLGANPDKRKRYDRTKTKYPLIIQWCNQCNFYTYYRTLRCIVCNLYIDAMSKKCKRNHHKACDSRQCNCPCHRPRPPEPCKL